MTQRLKTDRLQTHPVLDRLGGLLLTVFTAIYASQIPAIADGGQLQTGSLTPASVPSAIALFLGVVSLWLVFKPSPVATKTYPGGWLRAATRLLLSAVGMLLFSLLIKPAGFVFASWAFLASAFYLLGRQEGTPVNALHSLLLAGAITGVLWVLMALLLGAALPAWPAALDS